MAQAPHLLHPISDEYIGAAGISIVTVGGKDQLGAVIGKHREGVEVFVEGDLLQASAVEIDHKEIETAACF